MENRVEPRTLPGFMELLPEKQIEFNRMKDIIRKNYEKYGFLLFILCFRGFGY